MPGRLRIYLDALASAQPRQLRARALDPVNRRRRGRGPAGTPRPLVDAVPLWRGRAFVISDRGRYPPTHRLARFHRHYGEDVLAAARTGEAERARSAIEAWIAANPPARGDAWHPYPLSTRVGNWIAALSLEPSLARPAVVESLRRQLAFLNGNLELGVLGNHLIRNARALALGAAAFEDRRLAEAASTLLRRELREQVLPDGGHYERSPVYHLIVLRDLLEIRAATGRDDLDETIERMVRFGAALTRPDGAPALFNDGALDLAPDLRDFLPIPPQGLTLFPDTGYAVVRGGKRWLAVDCGPLAPRFLPAHAHADALSFQLWSADRPLVVDPGTFAYEADERDWFRSTPAHSTVAIDGQSQCVFWGAFRAAFLPRVELHDAGGDAAAGTVVASVRGFPGVRGYVHHRRTIRWSAAGATTIEDEITARGRHHIVSTIPLAPGVGHEQVGVTCDGADVAVERRSVSERFYERADAIALIAETDAVLPRNLGWRIAPTGPAR